MQKISNEALKVDKISQINAEMSMLEEKIEERTVKYSKYSARIFSCLDSIEMWIELENKSPISMDSDLANLIYTTISEIEEISEDEKHAYYCSMEMNNYYQKIENHILRYKFENSMNITELSATINEAKKTISYEIQQDLKDNSDDSGRLNDLKTEKDKLIKKRTIFSKFISKLKK